MKTAEPVGARGGLSAIFFVNGVVLASWVAHIPEGYLAGPPLIGLAAELIASLSPSGSSASPALSSRSPARALPASLPLGADALLASSTPEPG